MILRSVITCPHCATAQMETMPTDACQFFYQCTGCGALLRPKEGDCCVFCSYGSAPCPPVQAAHSDKTETPAIACTLAPGAYQERLTWIGALLRDALRSYERHDLVLDLRFAPEARDRIRELVRHEQDCCTFFSFDLLETPGEIQLIITAPEAVREAADGLFEPFTVDGKLQNAPQTLHS